MSDETIGVWHDPEIEVRIVNLVLGEASDFEKAELLQMIGEDKGLEQFYEEMCELHGVIGTAVTADDDAEWKLSEAKRNVVLEKLGQALPQAEESSERTEALPPSTSHYQWRSFMSIAACLIVTLFIMAVMFPLEKVFEPESFNSLIAKSTDQRQLEETVELEGGVEIVGGTRFVAEMHDDPFADDGGPIPQDRLDALPASERESEAKSESRYGFSSLATTESITAKPKKSPQIKIEGSIYAKDAKLSQGVADTILAKPQMTNQVERKGSAPSSNMARVIPSNSATAVPVPEVALDEVALDFGDGEDFGDGWGGAHSDAGGFGTPEEEKDSRVVTRGNRSGSYAVLGKTDALKSLAEAKKQPSDSGYSSIIVTGSLGSVDDSDVVDILAFKDTSKQGGSEEAKSSSAASLYRAEGYANLGKFDQAAEAYREVLKKDSYNKEARLGLEKIAKAKSSYYKEAYDQTRSELLMEVDEAWELEVPNDAHEKGDSLRPGFSVGENGLVQHEIARRAAQVQESDAALLDGRRLFADGNYQSAVDAYTKALNLLPSGPAVADRRSTYAGHLADASVARASQLGKSGDVLEGKEVLAKALKLAPENTKLKAKLQELQSQKPVIEEISASEQTHSTFSLNVNDASYKLAKAALLERGEWPAAESIRTEEFINAFDYGDPQPSMAQKVACAQDQAVHPFLQQRNLLRLSMSTAAQGRSTPLNLVILLDHSGSMERPDRAATVLRALQELCKQLGPNDTISLMSFARETRLLADGVRGDQFEKLIELVKNRPSEGGTNLEQAVGVAQKHLLARQKKGVQSRIVVLTDGAANLGDADPESLGKMVESMRDAGVAFDACGIGFDGLDDGILEALTRKGDGRYYVLDKPEDADASFGKQIAGALRPAAKNVKVQVVFNPDRVGKYRLLGFEKHRLNKEDFRNDAVDAAEMAAEESGSALYQIEAKADGTGEVGTVFVRFQDMATGQMVERSWTIPYQSSATSLEDARPAMQLAAVAGLLGEKLHKSDAGSTDFSQMSKVLGKLNVHFSENKNVQELLQMVRKVSK